MASGTLPFAHKLPIMTEGRDQILQSNSSPKWTNEWAWTTCWGREGGEFIVHNRRKQAHIFLGVSEDAHLTVCPSSFEV